jgi:hypothetical protein
MALPYAQQPFSQRIKRAGDMAEAAFKSYARDHDIDAEMIGFKKSKLRGFKRIPPLLRSFPDFICSGKRNFLVEAKGGMGNYMKIKPKNIETMLHWNEYLELWVFLYNSTRHEGTLIPLQRLIDATEGRKINAFADGNEYYNIPTSLFEWEKITDPPLKEEE